MKTVKMTKTAFWIILWLFLPWSLQAATIYKWVDKNGVVNFTDDYTKVPPAYRDRVDVEQGKDVQEGGTRLPSQEITTKGKEEEITTKSKEEAVRTDSDGRGEAWWRERVRPWKEKLKEATANHESANKMVIEKAEGMSRKNWSPTQYKMNMVELEKLKEERSKYQAQIDEANEELKKLAKQAEDAKADPEWLK